MIAAVLLVVVIPLVGLIGLVTAQAVRVAETVTPWAQRMIAQPDRFTDWIEQQPGFRHFIPYEDQILERAADLLRDWGRCASALLSGRDYAPRHGTLDALADALVGLEYYLESVVGLQPNDHALLEFTEDCIRSLERSIDQAKDEMAASAVPEPLPAEAPAAEAPAAEAPAEEAAPEAVEATETAAAAEVAADGERLTGSLSRHTRAELDAEAERLGIEIDPDWKKDDVVAAVQAHYDENPESDSSDDGGDE